MTSTRYLVMIVLLVLTVPAWVDAGIEQEDIIFFRGDVNGDGSMNISDPIDLAYYLFGSGPIPDSCAQVWDADGNGAVDVTDVNYLLDYLFAGGPPPTPSLVLCYPD